MLEFSIPGNSFGISEDPVRRTQIHKHLQRLAGTVCSQYRKAKPGAEQQVQEISHLWVAAKGNHTIAVAKGVENNYKHCKSHLQIFLNEINRLSSSKKIEVNNKVINLEFFVFFLGGDYKFILPMKKLKGTTSYYVCLWCKVQKDNRWYTSFLLDHYECLNLKGTIKEMSKLAKKKGKDNNYCCEHGPPTFNRS